MRLRRSLLALALIAGLCIAVPASAGKTHTWTVSFSGTSFSGAFRNPIKKIVNTIAISTWAGNPVTQLKVAGHTCVRWSRPGGYICARTISVGPGKTVKFSGKTKKALKPGEQLFACYGWGPYYSKCTYLVRPRD